MFKDCLAVKLGIGLPIVVIGLGCIGCAKSGVILGYVAVDPIQTGLSPGDIVRLGSDKSPVIVQHAPASIAKAASSETVLVNQTNDVDNDTFESQFKAHLEPVLLASAAARLKRWSIETTSFRVAFGGKSNCAQLLSLTPDRFSQIPEGTSSAYKRALERALVGEADESGTPLRVIRSVARCDEIVIETKSDSGRGAGIEINAVKAEIGGKLDGQWIQNRNSGVAYNGPEPVVFAVAYEPLRPTAKVDYVSRFQSVPFTNDGTITLQMNKDAVGRPPAQFDVGDDVFNPQLNNKVGVHIAVNTRISEDRMHVVGRVSMYAQELTGDSIGEQFSEEAILYSSTERPIKAVWNLTANHRPPSWPGNLWGIPVECLAGVKGRGMPVTSSSEVKFVPSGESDKSIVRAIIYSVNTKSTGTFARVEFQTLRVEFEPRNGD